MTDRPADVGPAFTYRTIVEFADTDMAGIMHFSNFFRFMERAEHAFWRSIGLSVTTVIDGKRVSWPRVQASCDYKLPLRFEEAVDIEVILREVRGKAVKFGFRFLRSESRELAAEGSITAVCAAYDGSAGRMRAIEIPAEIAQRLSGHTG